MHMGDSKGNIRAFIEWSREKFSYTSSLPLQTGSFANRSRSVSLWGGGLGRSQWMGCISSNGALTGARWFGSHGLVEAPSLSLALGMGEPLRTSVRIAGVTA